MMATSNQDTELPVHPIFEGMRAPALQIQNFQFVQFLEKVSQSMMLSGEKSTTTELVRTDTMAKARRLRNIPSLACQP